MVLRDVVFCHCVALSFSVFCARGLVALELTLTAYITGRSKRTPGVLAQATRALTLVATLNASAQPAIRG